ncbi:unnamed protein product [Lampetra fluviatilis]
MSLAAAARGRPRSPGLGPSPSLLPDSQIHVGDGGGGGGGGFQGGGLGVTVTTCKMAAGVAVGGPTSFSAWLGTQGASASMALALEQELGIGSEDTLLACAEDPHIRAELLSLARRRLPFGSYAVLARLLRGVWRLRIAAETLGGAEAAVAAAALPTDSCQLRCGEHSLLSSLLHAIVITLSSLSQELQESAERFSCLDGLLQAGASPRGTGSPVPAGLRAMGTQGCYNGQTLRKCALAASGWHLR